MSTAGETTQADQIKQVYTLCQRAARLRRQGQYGQAEELFKQALALAEAVFAPDALELAALLNNHAVLYKYSGQYAVNVSDHRAPPRLT